MNVTDYLLDNPAPDEKVFMIHGEDGYRYGQITAAVNSVADYLIKMGLKRGDRIFIIYNLF